VSGVKVAVVGLGKMGLSAAAFYAHRGATVTGVDIDARVVAAVEAGRSPIGREPGVAEHLGELVAAGRLRATTSFSAAVGSADVVLVLVPLTAFDGRPDLSSMDAAVEWLAPSLRPGATVIFETTLPLGTTRGRFLPRLRAAQPEVSVAFSPERVSSGRVWKDLDTYPKLVGGVDAASTAAAVAFYERFLAAEVWDVGSAETAEMIKLAETTYRDVNIAFANELARLADEWGVDVTTVIAGANSQPYSHIHLPGVGVGGHCIPHYPYLLQASTSGSSLVAAARAVNEEMPRWVAERIAREAGSLEGKLVLVLGLAYRPGVPEVASSPTFPLVAELERRGAKVVVADPLFDDARLEAHGFTPWAGDEPSVIVLVTAHDDYRRFPFDRYPPALVVDGRNVWDRAEVERYGHRYLGIGR